MPALPLREIIESESREPVSVRAIANRPTATGALHLRNLLEDIRSASRASGPPVVIWNGFFHAWEYNHRLNRFGSYIRSGARGRIRTGHPAASGAGPDRLAFSDYFTELLAIGVRAQYGTTTVRIRSTESSPGLFAIEQPVELSAPLRKRDRYVVLLNGFDLCAKRDADKLISFSLAAGEPRVSRAGDRLSFDLSGLLNLDCDSFECDGLPTWEFVAPLLAPGSTGLALGSAAVKLAGKFNIAVDYRLRIEWIVLAGQHHSFAAVPMDPVERELEWNTSEALDPAAGASVARFEVPPRWVPAEAALGVGIRSLAIAVSRERGLLEPDDAMHMLEWHTGLHRMSVSRQHVDARVLLFFRNWKPGMKRAHMPHSLTSRRDAGRARLGLGLTMLQLRKARHLAMRERPGKSSWKPAQASDRCADDPQTRNEEQLPLGRGG